MKPAPFIYHDPRTKAEALSLLATRENARLLAGGQSLVPMLNFRLATPDHLIDLNCIGELAGIECRAGTLRIGAMARQSEIELSEAVRTALPLLKEALAHVGHCQTRNRGTIGGSLCHLDPAAELVTAAVAADATLVAERAAGARRISIHEWCQGYLTNALAEDEMLTAVELPAWPAAHSYSFVEYARRHGDFAIVAVAVLMALQRGGQIERVSISIGGCAYRPVRLADAEATLEGKHPSAALFKSAGRMAAQVEAVSDPYVQADYRRHLARVLTERALTAAAGRARQGGLP